MVIDALLNLWEKGSIFSSNSILEEKLMPCIVNEKNIDSFYFIGMWKAPLFSSFGCPKSHCKIVGRMIEEP